MKKIIVSSLLCAAVLFCACHEKEEEPTPRSTTAALESVAMDTSEFIPTLEIPIRIASPMQGEMICMVEVVDGTAVSTGANWDYKLASTQVIIAPGQTEGKAVVTIKDSEATREARTFTFKLVSVTGALAHETCKVDAQMKTCEVTIKPARVEVDFYNRRLVVTKAMSPVALKLCLYRSTDRDVTITFAPKDGGTAEEGVHYRIGSKQLTIKKGEMTVETSVEILANTAVSCEFEITEATGNADVAPQASCVLDIKPVSAQ